MKNVWCRVHSSISFSKTVSDLQGGSFITYSSDVWRYLHSQRSTLKSNEIMSMSVSIISQWMKLFLCNDCEKHLTWFFVLNVFLLHWSFLMGSPIIIPFGYQDQIDKVPNYSLKSIICICGCCYHLVIVINLTLHQSIRIKRLPPKYLSDFGLLMEEWRVKIILLCKEGRLGLAANSHHIDTKFVKNDLNFLLSLSPKIFYTSTYLAKEEKQIRNNI